MLSDLVVDVVLIVVGIGILYVGADWLVRGAAHLATSFGISPIVVGLTIVSFGTSAPELVVCVVAAIEGRPALATGNVVGSNLANIGLILGLTALVAPLNVQARVVLREIPFMLGVTLLLYPLIALDYVIGRGGGLFLVGVFALYLVLAFRASAPLGAELDDLMAGEGSGEGARPGPRWRDAGLVVVGCLALVGGGYVLVGGAVNVGTALGVSEVVIGLTVVAIGTSLPELATSLVAAVRGEVDIAVGNVIGSNIFNITGILGTTAIIAPIPIARSVLTHELAAVVLMSLLLFPLVRLDWRLRRWEGALLLVAYLGAGFYLI